MARFRRNHRNIAEELGVLAMFLTSVVVSARPAGAAPPVQAGPNVTIVSPLPLPVTGTTAVSGTVSVRDVDNAARSPIQIELCQSASFGGPTPTCLAPPSAAVPSTHRLVIEYVSGGCSVTPGVITFVRIHLGTTAGGTSASHVFPLTKDALDAGQLETALQTRIYADPGSTVGLGMTASAGPGDGFVLCVVTLSGHTVTP